ncbi:HD-GYP domain-containing protein [Azonexus sp.]|uniref:HD-GYP domain-containing protein n=1 Tax=Azonexus sp. TaxID=1872668 RepID=UPI0027BA386D|nr:HD domain-containing phosphohydrolase [Azonexus sp.]
MNSFNTRAAKRIGAVSVLLALLVSPIAWHIARETAEQEAMSLAMEESQRILSHLDDFTLDSPQLRKQAQEAAMMITGGLFDIAEIYDGNGNKLAESTTEQGHLVEHQLPKHLRPNYLKPSYESIHLPDEVWALRIFVPLGQPSSASSDKPLAYFEGVRIVPAWQKEEMQAGALTIALLVAAASLLCGMTIYPLVVKLSAENLRKAEEVLESHISIIEALGRAVARRDSDTGAHNYRVAWVAARIGEVLELPRLKMQSLIMGSFLHDVGKIGIPDAILLKPGRLDDAEMQIMRTHVEQGETIVSGIAWLSDAASIVSGHHEKWDGSGYPKGLRGDAIPLGARIFAVADVFDALRSERPYKKPMSFDAAISIIKQDTGSHFDASVVDAFLGIAQDIHDQLVLCDENACQALLQAKIREHFALPGSKPAN